MKALELIYVSDSSFWVGLGMVEKSPQRQQHAFIKAIQLDDTVSYYKLLKLIFLTLNLENVNAWNSLGFLYLQYGKLTAAKQGGFVD